MPLLKKSYSIQLRDQKDYNKLVKFKFVDNYYNIKTDFFDNETNISKDGDFLYVNIKLKVSLITIGFSILILGALYAIYASYGFFWVLAGIYTFYGFTSKIINNEYATIKNYIMNILY